MSNFTERELGARESARRDAWEERMQYSRKTEIRKGLIYLTHVAETAGASLLLQNSHPEMLCVAIPAIVAVNAKLLDVLDNMDDKYWFENYAIPFASGSGKDASKEVLEGGADVDVEDTTYPRLGSGK